MSAVEQAQEDLYTLVKADATFADALVLAGFPFDVQKKNERVYVSEDVVGWRRSRAGSDYVEETFSVVLVVEVFRSGEAPGPAKSRAIELVAAVDQMLERADYYGFGSEDGELEANLAVVAWDTGRLARVVITIPVTALS